MCNNVPKGIQVILAPALEESRTLASNSPKCTRSIRSTGTRVSPCSTYYNHTKVQWERNPDSSIQDTGTNTGRDFRRPEGEGAVEPSKQKKGTGREVQDRTCLGSRRGSVGSDGAAVAAGAVDDGAPFLRFPPPDGSPAASFSSLPSPPSGLYFALWLWAKVGLYYIGPKIFSCLQAQMKFLLVRVIMNA